MVTLLDVLAQTGPHGPMGPGTGGGMAGGAMGGGLFPWVGAWGGLLGLLVMLGVLGAVVYGAVALATRAGGTVGPRREDEDADALDVLDRRYARGELDEEEYEVRRRWLRGE